MVQLFPSQDSENGVIQLNNFVQKLVTSDICNLLLCNYKYVSICFELEYIVTTLLAVWAMASKAQRQLDFPVRKSSRTTRSKTSQSGDVMKANDSRGTSGSSCLEQSLGSKYQYFTLIIMPCSFLLF